MSDPTASEVSDDTAVFISASGGGFRGPIQYWVMYHLVVTIGIPVRLFVGTSAGSLNGSMFALRKEEDLLAIYDSISGKRPFLRLRLLHLVFYPLALLYWFLSDLAQKHLGWTWPLYIGGLYSMRPLRKKLQQYIHVADFKYPFVAHVISANTGARYQIDSRQVDDARLQLGIEASSSMPPFMQPPTMQLDEDLNGEELGWDGGYRDIFPPIPEPDIEAAKTEGKKIIIHAIGCTPRERVSRIQRAVLQSEWSMALRAVSIFEAEIFDNDIVQLQYQAGSGGEVHLWVPGRHPGESFDASKAAIQDRLLIGKEMVEAGPVILPGLCPHSEDGL